MIEVLQNLIDNALNYSPPGGVVDVEIGRGESREAVITEAGRRRI